MNPFDLYPEDGRKPLRSPKDWSNCRHGYGLELQRLTGQTRCAYCQVSLVDDYYHWLLMSVDHVIPRGAGKAVGIQSIYLEDFINLVLCCAGCNSFNNRYVIPNNLKERLPDTELERFLALRDRVFEDRRARIAERRAREQDFFAGKPWEKAIES